MLDFAKRWLLPWRSSSKGKPMSSKLEQLEIQAFDNRVAGKWEGVTGPIDSPREANKELQLHRDDWPNIEFRIAPYPPIEA